ncbi:MAG: glycosyltransferase family 4 protein, partial [Actinomadura sp.]
RRKPGGASDAAIKALGLEAHVEFVTDVPERRIIELYSEAEMAVVPSLYEGFSLPAVEHMASGSPLVASRTGALPEVVGDAGILVEPGDVEQLAATLHRLHDSSEERTRVGAAGLQRVRERFAWPAVALSTVEHYRAAIDASHAFGGTAARPPRSEGAAPC